MLSAKCCIIYLRKKKIYSQHKKSEDIERIHMRVMGKGLNESFLIFGTKPWKLKFYAGCRKITLHIFLTKELSEKSFLISFFFFSEGRFSNKLLSKKSLNVIWSSCRFRFFFLRESCCRFIANMTFFIFKYLTMKFIFFSSVTFKYYLKEYHENVMQSEWQQSDLIKKSICWIKKKLIIT